MNDKLPEEQVNQVIKILDDLLADGPWDSSNFLRVIGKNIKEIRNEFVQNTLGEQTKLESTLFSRMAQRSNQKEIYILLYSADGERLESWEKIISNLPQQTVSRPVYAEEKDVKSAIRAKEKTVNQGYVAVYVSPSDILSIEEDKIPMDKIGTKLLSLKDRSIKHPNISRFVHMTGTYKLVGSRLVRETP